MSTRRRRLSLFSENTISNKTHRRRSKRLMLEECEDRRLLAVFTVTSSLDTGAVGELRWAVNSANMTPGHDLINFDVGNVALTQGELPITNPVTIDGTTPMPVLIDISAAPNSRIFNVNDGNPFTSIPVDMVQLQLRQGDVSAFIGGQGGAILNHERLNFDLSLISESRANEGGGIANHGYLRLDGSTISEGTATGTGGGGLYNAPTSVAVISASSILANTATSGAGGGVLNQAAEIRVVGDSLINNNGAAAVGGGVASRSGGSVSLRSASLTFNEASIGGGVSIAGEDSSLVTGAGVLVESNVADSGAGIAVYDHGNVEIFGSVLSGNRADTEGGGIWAQDADAQITSAQLISNQAGNAFGVLGRGGGIFANNGAAVNVEGTIFSYNGATAIPTGITAGGGAFVGNGAVLTMNASTLTGNVGIRGGGVYAIAPNDGLRPSVSITYSNLSGNIGYAAGAGVYAGPGTDLYLKCVTLDNNNVTAGAGGGIYLRGGSEPRDVSAVIKDSTIVGNLAYSDGGGIASVNGVTMDITNTVISSNSANNRGGGVSLGTAPDIDGAVNETKIELSLVSGNVVDNSIGPVAFNRAGGGLWAGNGARVVIDATTFESNHAASQGGGIALRQVGRFQMTDSTVSGNTSLNGGGASVIRSDASFVQTTFYGNRADSHGGGLYIESTLPNQVDILHSTISLNSANGLLVGPATGGGIYAGNTAAVYALQVNLDHTIVSTNLGAPLGGFDEVYDGGTPTGNPLVTARYSLIRDNSNTTFAPGNPDPNGNKIGTPALPIDAMLQPLGANGGPTLTMLPSNTSPAINAGDPLFSSPPVGDQRQLPYKRVAFGQIDMGSVEIQPPPPDPDFNNDGVANCHDINALTTDVAGGLNTPSFDLTGDGLVNLADVEKWLEDAPEVNGLAITRYLPGDVNLDTFVDGFDFLIWNGNKLTANSNWCDGDLNADGFIDGEDFRVWNANKFTSSPVPNGCGFFRHDAPSGDSETPNTTPMRAERLAVDVALSEWSADEARVPKQLAPANQAPVTAPATIDLLGSDLADEEEDKNERRRLTMFFGA